MSDVVEGFGAWLYAITASPGPREWTGVSGVGGAPVRTVEAAGLAGVVSSVPLDQFGEEPLRRHLEDLDWLTATARAHDAVVGVVARSGATVPMRLAAVYLDDSRVGAMLAERRVALETALERLSGRAEWGVKAYGRPELLTERAPEPVEAPSGSGTAYLLRRRAQLSAGQAAQELMERHSLEIHAALSIIAVASRRHRPQDPKLTGGHRRMALNGSYLVDAERAQEFAAAVAALDDERSGLQLELTGPWPPYSFAGLDEVQP